MNFRNMAFIAMLASSLCLQARDYGWSITLGGSGGAVIPWGGYADFMGQELSDQEGRSIVLMGPLAGLGVGGGIRFLPWLGVGLDASMALSLPLFRGDAAAWIFYVPELGFRIGPDLLFPLDEKKRLVVAPRFGASLLPLGLWEGSSFSGVSSIEHESWRGTSPSLEALLCLRLETGGAGGSPGWYLSFEAGSSISSLLEEVIWGGSYNELRFSLGGGLSWSGISDFRIRKRSDAEGAEIPAPPPLAEEAEEGDGE